MIIATNSARLINTTEDISGKLKSLSANQTTEFLAFKPTTVCRVSGYLTLEINGLVYMYEDNMTFNLDLGITIPGSTTYTYPIILDRVLMQGTTNFTAKVNIPLITSPTSDDRYVYATSHVGNFTAVQKTLGVIFVDADQVVTMGFSYNIPGVPATPTSSVIVYNVIAEYKEN
ncbi:hypothetical protein [Chitinophaga defluvii]|uniref:Uncharacterized protein n=1 Tax=Chitinophaga defluvii TaxID=3163343 RepID=A0ABV2TBR9_9BACT